jgi:hypothetical protein
MGVTTVDDARQTARAKDAGSADTWQYRRDRGRRIGSLYARQAPWATPMTGS